MHVKSNVKAHPADAVVADVAKLLKEDLKESEGASIEFVTKVRQAIFVSPSPLPDLYSAWFRCL